jgi:hypothetical protein
MFGAVSSTDVVLDNELAVGLYDRVGDDLYVWYKGKRGSESTFDFVGDTRSTNRVCIDFLLGICDEFTAAAPELEFSALPASRKKSTMSASAAFCLPTSDGVMRLPSAAVVLFAPDMVEADSSKEGLLRWGGR